MMRHLVVLSLLVLCLTVCISHDYRPEYLFTGEDYFKKMAFSSERVTDKVNGHVYQKMYGMVLLPQIEKHSYMNKKLKFLEIGFGCGSYYGPGASIKVWQQMFKGRDVAMWEAEYDEECVTSYGKQGKLKGVSVLTGNYSDPKMARKWVRKSGGKFDVIVYDGNHKNSHILNTFLALWPALNPGGNYFIEDMEVGFNPINQEDGYPPITKVRLYQCLTFPHMHIYHCTDFIIVKCLESNANVLFSLYDYTMPIVLFRLRR